MDLNERVDRLLHDAEHAKAGATFAAMMHDDYNARQLANKSQNLLNEALALDPQHTAPAWSETDMEVP